MGDEMVTREQIIQLIARALNERRNNCAIVEPDSSTARVMFRLADNKWFDDDVDDETPNSLYAIAHRWDTLTSGMEVR